MIRRFGLEAVWRLHLTAAAADRRGQKAAALYVAEIADAAERELLNRRADDIGRPLEESR
jgi:hypothetical protein